jgi:4-amino-4-deoxy-L-arabinose transferase-like glycosyltransferase
MERLHEIQLATCSNSIAKPMLAVGCSPTVQKLVKPFGVLVLFLAVLLFFRLGGRGLNEPDEGRYANIAQEMLEPDGSWLDPRMNDLGHYDKPPLIYWTTAASFMVLGMNETSARIPSVMGACLTLAGLGWAAYRLYGHRTTLLALLIAGTSVQFWVLARFLTPDMLLTGWITLAIAAWVETRHRGGSRLWWCLQVLFWTLAWWTKATPMLVPLLGLVFYCMFDAEGRRALRPVRLVLLVLLLGSPWFIWMMQNHSELKDFFFHREMAGRLTGHVDGRKGPVYYYLLISLIAWFPWWPWALVRFWGIRKFVSQPGVAIRRIGPEGWLLATGMLVFSCVSSKLPTYTLPLLPWAALLMARALRNAGSRAIYTVAGTTSLAYLVFSLVVPHYESSFHANSSMRPLAALLHREGARELHADRYWPGLEYYWGEAVHYTRVRVPIEVHDGSDSPSEHFEDEFTTGPGQWFVHYRRQNSSPFQKWLDDPAIPKTTLGDFIVGPLR